MECNKCGDLMEDPDHKKCCFCRLRNRLSQAKRRSRLSTHRPTEEGLDFSQISKYIIQLRVKILDKINSHKSYDKSRNIFDEENFIDFEEVFLQICKQEGRCKYCRITVKFLNYQPYQQNQFSIDRIDSTRGHVKNNVHISCLKCNCKKGKKTKKEYINILQQEQNV